MNVYCIVMFKFNYRYNVGDIKNSDLEERIVCLGEGSGVRKREVWERGEGSGECLPPVHHLIKYVTLY